MAELKKTSERSIEFGYHLIDEFRAARPRDDLQRHIWRELFKAGTSVAANTGESSGAQSNRDFVQKFQIALKEGKETLVWLRFLRHANPGRGTEIDRLCAECDTIVAILVASLRTAKHR
jgi:four helix bundle protein